MILSPGYIKDFQVEHDAHRVGTITVELQGRIKDCKVLTYRQDIKANEIKEYTTRALPTRQVHLYSLILLCAAWFTSNILHCQTILYIPGETYHIKEKVIDDNNIGSLLRGCGRGKCWFESSLCLPSVGDCFRTGISRRTCYFPSGFLVVKLICT